MSATADADLERMRQALAEAAMADYATSPNPMVGAVIFDAKGRQLAAAHHDRAGAPHAEVQALAKAGAKARGATLYTNLEPCTHHGRTPPCADALIAAGVKRVVVAMEDPDDRVRGGGVRKLREAGVEVSLGVLEEEARRLNRFYVKQRSTGLPWVTAKWAMTLDGKIATVTGDARWVTGEQARNHGHLLRHQHDAILVGVETVLADDPRLTARPESKAGRTPRQPLKVVVDSHLRTPPDAQLLQEGQILIATLPGSEERAAWLKAAGADVQAFTAERGRVDLVALMRALAQRGVLSVLAEGGERIHGSLFEKELIDAVAAYIAPKVAGGGEAPGPVGGGGVELMAKAPKLGDVRVERLGDDLLVSGDVHRHR